MLVKCKICGQKQERNAMYKVTRNDKNEYYCNEEEYKILVKERECKTHIYITINEIFGYKVVNTLLMKELKGLVEVSSYSKLWSYLSSNKEYLTKVMTKQFNNEVGKIRYFSAVVKNNIIDHIENEKNNVVNVTYDINDIEKIKYKPKARRKCIMDYLKED